MTTFKLRYQVIEWNKTGDQAIFETKNKEEAIKKAEEINGWIFDIWTCKPVEF